jgi:hypothetical protein
MFAMITSHLEGILVHHFTWIVIGYLTRADGDLASCCLAVTQLFLESRVFLFFLRCRSTALPRDVPKMEEDRLWVKVAGEKSEESDWALKNKLGTQFLALSIPIGTSVILYLTSVLTSR